MFEYAVITRASDVDLRDAVTNLAALGWRPQGGVAVGYREEMEDVLDTIPAGARAWRLPSTKHRMYWVQAMIREGEQK